MSFLKKNKTAWSLYLSAIEGKIAPTRQGESIFQPLAVLQRAGWDYEGKDNYNLYLQNAVSDTVLRWGSIGTDSNKDIGEIYEDLLNRAIRIVADEAGTSVDLSEEEKSKLESYKSSQENAEREKRYYKGLAIQDWEDYQFDNDGDPYMLRKREFLRNNSNWILYKGFDDQSKSFAYQILKITARSNDADSEFLNAIKMKLEDPSFKIRLPDQLKDEDSPNLWALFLKQHIRGDIFKFKKEQKITTISVNDTVSESRTVSESWGGAIGVSYGPLSFGGGASGSSLDQEARNIVQSVSMTFDNMEEMPIERADWFSMYFLERFGKKCPEFWGPNGYMSVIPTSVILVKGIKIEVISTSDYTKRVEKHFNYRKTVKWGPFKFSSNYSKSSVHSKIATSGDRFTIQSITNDPYILGYRCTTPNSKSDVNFMLKSFEKFDKITKDYGLGDIESEKK